MHTTETLLPEHFRCVRPGREPDRPGDLSALLPGFGESDRLGIASPVPLEGIRDAGYAALACVTAYYSMHQGEPGSIYPEYCALYAAGQPGADAWGELDIWPAARWIATDGTPERMLTRALQAGVTRLLWPAQLAPAVPALPAPLRAAARSQLRSVLLFGAGTPAIRLLAAQPAEDLVRRAVERMPGLAPADLAAFTAGRPPRRDAGGASWAEGYAVLTPESFTT